MSWRQLVDLLSTVVWCGQGSLGDPASTVWPGLTMHRATGTHRAESARVTPSSLDRGWATKSLQSHFRLQGAMSLGFRVGTQLLEVDLPFRYPKASNISSPPCLLRLLQAGAVAGWGLHPLESAAFSRRTPISDIRRRELVAPRRPVGPGRSRPAGPAAKWCSNPAARGCGCCSATRTALGTRPVPALCCPGSLGPSRWCRALACLSSARLGRLSSRC